MAYPYRIDANNNAADVGVVKFQDVYTFGKYLYTVTRSGIPVGNNTFNPTPKWGIYKSADEGVTWSPVGGSSNLAPPSDTNYSNLNSYPWVTAPSQRDPIVAGHYGNATFYTFSPTVHSRLKRPDKPSEIIVTYAAKNNNSGQALLSFATFDMVTETVGNQHENGPQVFTDGKLINLGQTTQMTVCGAYRESDDTYHFIYVGARYQMASALGSGLIRKETGAGLHDVAVCNNSQDMYSFAYYSEADTLVITGGTNWNVGTYHLDQSGIRDAGLTAYMIAQNNVPFYGNNSADDGTGFVWSGFVNAAVHYVVYHNNNGTWGNATAVWDTSDARNANVYMPAEIVVDPDSGRVHLFSLSGREWNEGNNNTAIPGWSLNHIAVANNGTVGNNSVVTNYNDGLCGVSARQITLGGMPSGTAYISNGRLMIVTGQKYPPHGASFALPGLMIGNEAQDPTFTKYIVPPDSNWYYEYLVSGAWYGGWTILPMSCPDNILVAWRGGDAGGSLTYLYYAVFDANNNSWSAITNYGLLGHYNNQADGMALTQYTCCKLGMTGMMTVGTDMGFWMIPLTVAANNAAPWIIY